MADLDLKLITLAVLNFSGSVILFKIVCWKGDENNYFIIILQRKRRLANILPLFARFYYAPLEMNTINISSSNIT